jgi:histidyl-tRNA synthetase
MEALQAIPGTNDILPPESTRWDRLRLTVEGVMSRYGYGRIETPIFEAEELFARGVGATTDVVQKEMYAFTDQGGRRLALRPEGTAGVVRAYIESRLDKQKPFTKLWYWGPMFRAERPQKGRYRQFWQFGVEALGASQPQIDAEQVLLAAEIAETCGLRGWELKLNSIGDAKCRPAYTERLVEYLRGIRTQLCGDCQRRIDTNPLRVLDCKEERCRAATADAPLIVDSLCADCSAHFAVVRRLLDAARIPYTVDGRLVRGLDYYERTAFELIAPNLGAQSAVFAGGRYDGLVELLGGPSVPGVGWAAGVERLLLASTGDAAAGPLIDVFVACFPETLDLAMEQVQHLRRAGLRADLDFLGRSIKAQMKEAARSEARFVVVAGPEELKRGVVTVRDMAAGSQDEVSEATLVDELRGRFGA